MLILCEVPGQGGCRKDVVLGNRPAEEGRRGRLEDVQGPDDLVGGLVAEPEAAPQEGPDLAVDLDIGPGDFQFGIEESRVTRQGAAGQFAQRDDVVVQVPVRHQIVDPLAGMARRIPVASLVVGEVPPPGRPRIPLPGRTDLELGLSDELDGEVIAQVKVRRADILVQVREGQELVGA